MHPQNFPLQWPEGQPRAPSRVKSPFRCRLAVAVADLEDALRLFGRDTGSHVRDIVISSNVTIGRERPADPGIAVYFEWDGAWHCIAVDRYMTPVENIRAVYHIVEARRVEMRHGGLGIVRAAFKGFLALPPASSWRDVLGVGPQDSIEAAETAYRASARTAHPDKPGGSAEAMARLNAAIASARREIGSTSSGEKA